MISKSAATQQLNHRDPPKCEDGGLHAKAMLSAVVHTSGAISSQCRGVAGWCQFRLSPARSLPCRRNLRPSLQFTLHGLFQCAV